MRLLIPIIIIVLGMLSGAVISRLFPHNEKGFNIGVISGGIGALVGIAVRDLLDIKMNASIMVTLLAAIIGAMVFSAAANLLYKFTRR